MRLRGFDENILKLDKSATLNTKPWPGKFFSGNSLNFCKQIWSFLSSCCPHFWKHGFEKSKSIKSDLEEKWVDYPWKYFAEFEKDGKLKRQKTWSPDWKAKASDHSHWIFSFIQHRQLFYKWSCDSHELKINWFQINGHLEDAKVQVWRPNDNSQSLQFCDSIYRAFGGNF